MSLVELENRLRQHEVIPFVGAGVSRAVLRRDGMPLFPGWRDLLLHAARRLSEKGKEPEERVVQGLVESSKPDFLEAAKRARQGLGPLWPSFLEEEIGPPFDRVDPESLALARGVWDLGSPLLVTTNYDKVLQWACPESSAKDLEFWDIEAKAEQAHLHRSWRPSRPTVWHLHGRIGNTAELILTPDGYQRLYEDGSERRYQAALTTFRALLASRSLLFLGFSFEDEALGVQLKSVSELFAETTGPHFALVPERDLPRLRTLALPIEFVPFADFGEPLLALVRRLGAAAPPSGAPVVSAPAVSYSTDNRPFFVPFKPKGDKVIGAEPFLQRVREQLTQGRPTSIGQTAAFQGLGGLGKTQLAVEYAWRYGEEYPNGVIWLTADQDISAQLTRLAVEAKWVAAEADHQFKLEVAQRRVRSSSDCLIVFDNLEDRATITPYLPLPSARPHLLVTSRTEQPGFVPVPLELLDKERSLELLISEAGRSPIGAEEEEAAQEIARELGGLPLALEMAGAFLYRPVQWREYWSLLQSRPKEALRGKHLDSFTGHEADLYATLRIQEGLFDDEPLLGEVLDVLTWSGSASMGISLLAALLAVEETALLSALSLGVQLRLLERSSTAGRYGLHRLVRQVRQEDRPLGEHATWVDEICVRLGEWFATRRQDFADLATFEAEIDHLRTWREQAVSLGSAQGSRLTWLLAYPPYHRGQYQESHRWLDKALTLYEGEAQSDLALKAWIWNDLGAISSEEGLSRKALEFHQRALELRRKILGKEHPDTATSLDSVGAVHQRLHDYVKALDHGTQALEVRRKALGEEHRDTASSLAHVGTIHNNLGASTQALEHHTLALAIRRRVLGEEHPATGMSLGGIAGVHYTNGNLGEALEFSELALDIRLRALGNDHPDTIESILTTAKILKGLNRGEEAFNLLRPYIKNPPRNAEQASLIKSAIQQLKAKPFQDGFRQPSARRRGKRKKKRR